jgi:hypothetical protein
MDVTKNDLEMYARAKGRKIEQVLTALAKKKNFKEAWNSQIGQELLLDNAVRLQELLDKIVDMEASDDEKIEFRLLRDITVGWANKIKQYLKIVKDIKECK